MSDPEADIEVRLPEGLITDEAVEKARQMVGVLLRPEGPYLQDATPDTMRNFCNGIGDVNPLYRDMEYGRRSRYGTMVGHPMFPYVWGWPGRTRWGFPGVHGFFAGNDWEFFRHIRPGDRINGIERVLAVELKEGRFSGRMAIQYTEAYFTNQRDELIARVLAWCTRHERQAAREAGKHREVQPHQYSPQELETIERLVLTEAERVRGGQPRYWEDVAEGEELPPVIRGPLSLMDTIGFLVGCGRGETHGLLLARVGRHPEHYYRRPEGGVEYTGMGHHREEVARQVGVPGTYDYGPQRVSWLCSLVTNWMGDTGVLKRLRVELRGFNLVGDTTWCRGRVSRKYVKDGYALVDIDIWAENQRGERTATGLATVILPPRDVSLKLAFDGTGVELGLPPVR
ncbi:MAG: acyl dehydratase [Chloroflexota bacterium]